MLALATCLAARLAALAALLAVADAAVLRGSRQATPDAALMTFAASDVAPDAALMTLTASELARRRAFDEIVDPAIAALLDGDSPKGELPDAVRRGAAVLDARTVGARLAATLPGDVANVLKALPNFATQNATGLAVQPSAQTLDPTAVQKAINKLNGMIAEAQSRLDRKDIECKEFKETSDENQRQVRSDLARLGETLSELKQEEIDSNNKIDSTGMSIESVTVEQKKASDAYQAQLKIDQAELMVHKADLKVSEFMLDLSKCEESGALVQITAEGASTQFEMCEDGNVSFDDSRLERSQANLSPKGRELLGFALGRAQMLAGSGEDSALHAAALAYGNGFDLENGDDGDDGDDMEPPGVREEALAEFHASAKKQKPGATATSTAVQGATSASTSASTSVAGTTNPVESKKQGKRCAKKKPDCGVLHDTFAELWGKMKDDVEALSKKMADRKHNFSEMDITYNTELDSLRFESSSMGKSLASTQATNAAESEVQDQKLSEQETLVSTHTKTMKECKATMRDILYNEICGTISVRNELIVATLKIKDADVVDCSVTDWTPGECSMTCDDKEVGGIQLMTRDVITDSRNHGAACPTLNMTKRCGQSKCPVDCKLSAWEEFSKCTKECGGGVQTRSRLLETKPLNGGKHCTDLQETRTCNTGSCDRNCKLSDWTPFGGCSQACGTGFMTRSKAVTLAKRGKGICWSSRDKLRLERKSCNTQACIGDELCVAKRDIVIAIDGSGSITEKGFDVLKEFAIRIIGRMKSEAYGQEAVNVAVVQFGNGHLVKGAVSDVILVEPLTGDLEKVATTIKGLQIQKGFTNMAQAFMKASFILKRTTRKTAQGTALFITDGVPSFKGSTWTALTKLKETSSVMMVQVKSFPKKENQKLVQSYASEPSEANYVHVPGKKALRQNYDAFTTAVISKMCPGAESPSALGLMVKQLGFKQTKADVICATDPTSSSDGYSAAGCVESLEMEWAMFAYKPPTSPETPGTCLIYAEPCKDLKEAAGYMLYESAIPAL